MAPPTIPVPSTPTAVDLIMSAVPTVVIPVTALSIPNGMFAALQGSIQTWCVHEIALFPLSIVAGLLSPVFTCTFCHPASTTLSNLDLSFGSSQGTSRLTIPTF